MVVEPSLWTLRCMNGSGSSPGEIIDHRLHLSSRDGEQLEHTFYIVQPLDGNNIDVREGHECTAATTSGDIIALVRTSA